MNIQEWAESYIRVHEDRASDDERHPDFEAAYVFMEVLTGDLAEQCWDGILAVISRQPSERVLGMLAAGPLEDLIHYSGDEYIERIEIEARRNPRFKECLNGVWKSGKQRTWDRVLIARGEKPENP